MMVISLRKRPNVLFSMRMSRKKSDLRAGNRGLHGVQKRVERPFQRALEWRRAPAERRQKLSRSQASDWLRIADLGAMGVRLDELEAPHYLVRWVAAPGKRRPKMREERFLAAVAALERGRWSKQRWREVRRATQAIVGPEKLGPTNAPSSDEVTAFAAMLAYLSRPEAA